MIAWSPSRERVSVTGRPAPYLNALVRRLSTDDLLDSEPIPNFRRAIRVADGWSERLGRPGRGPLHRLDELLEGRPEIERLPRERQPTGDVAEADAGGG